VARDEEVASMNPMFRHCEDCGGEQLFEQAHDVPGSCPDSLDGLCPEWSCTGCGTVLLAVFPLPRAELAPGPALVGRVA
jgi:hypothetical protein